MISISNEKLKDFVHHHALKTMGNSYWLSKPKVPVSLENEPLSLSPSKSLSESLTTTEGAIVFISVILIGLVILAFTGLIFYFYWWLPKQQMTTTRHVRERLVLQVLQKEKFAKFCQIIGIDVKFIHEERDNIYPKIEESKDFYMKKEKTFVRGAF